MTPRIFFTPLEISYLRNRRACGFLTELPGDPLWWDQDQNFKTTLLSDLHDSGLAQEAFELMFEDIETVACFYWRMVDFEEHELVMRNIRATDVQGGDPSNEETVNALRKRLKAIDVDAIQKGTGDFPVLADQKVEKALDNVWDSVVRDMLGQGVDGEIEDDIDDLTCGGFIVENSDELDDDMVNDYDDVDGMIDE